MIATWPFAPERADAVLCWGHVVLPAMDFCRGSKRLFAGTGDLSCQQPVNAGPDALNRLGHILNGIVRGMSHDRCIFFAAQVVDALHARTEFPFEDYTQGAQRCVTLPLDRFVKSNLRCLPLICHKNADALPLTRPQERLVFFQVIK